MQTHRDPAKKVATMKKTISISGPALPGWQTFDTDEYQIVGDLVYLYREFEPPEGGLARIAERRLVAVYRIDGLRVMPNA